MATNNNTEGDIATEMQVVERDVLSKKYGNSGSETPGHADKWMPVPEVVTDCPPGLEYLTQIDQVIINQVVEVIEAVTGFETKNQYKVRNSLGQNMYLAVEESTCIMRQCCGSSRPFELGIFDNSQTEIIRLIRPFRCNTCVGFCCLQEMEVQSPPGVTVGWIKQDWSLLSPRFSIKDENGECVYKLKGPCWTCKWCDVEFHLMSTDESEDVGAITKQWSGLAKEYFSDADNFGITFPMEMDVKIKAVMVGAVFLIDFMYFEQ